MIAYELVAPREIRPALSAAGNVIWGVFIVEFAVKVAVSGKPLRFLRRRWPSVLFLILPVLRILRAFRALRALRVLPAARVVGSSYRAVGTARGPLEGRLAFLVVATVIAAFSGGQLLSSYSVVVFAAVAAALGAFSVESRAERAAAEEPSAAE